LTKVPIVKPKSWRAISHSAYNFLRGYRPDLLKSLGPFPLVDFLEFDLKDLTGFDFSIGKLPLGIEATTDIAKKELILSEQTYEGLHHDDGRCRFTLAHEIGHIFEHGYLHFVSQRCLKAIRFNRGKIKPYMDPEAQANVFAASLLMPQPAILRMSEGERTASNICRLAKVSHEAARIRLDTLEKY